MDKPKKLKKCQQVEIDAADPFKNDVLNRKANVEILTQFITSYEQSIVLCIDAGWGQGKTTFIKMWQQYLKNQDIPTIYFNAWESDYTDDALIALIGEIGLSIQELVGEDKTIAEKILGHLYKLAVNFTKAAAPAMANLGIKAASGGLISADEISTAFGNLSESLVKEQITKYEESRKTLGSFKEALSKLARCYADGDTHKPLVFFIDELDRCRPNFAIEVLEKAKHLFNVDNIVFVLATDKTQLGHSIRAVYGQGLDVNGYLRRFIDFDYLLPKPQKNQEFFKRLIYKYNIVNFIKDFDYFFECYCFLLNKYNLTLREQESFFNTLNLILRVDYQTSLKENNSNHGRNIHAHYFFIFFLIILKIKFIELYKIIINSEDVGDLDILIKHINSYLISQDNNIGINIDWLKAVIIFIKVKQNKNITITGMGEVELFKSYLKKYDLSPERYPFYSLLNSNYRNFGNELNFIIKIIDLNGNLIQLN
ncbi:KAP family P-loop NTPase fold protein [Snodgrassella communis]|uniref:KAP family P-loop NTPase fold protein n=1 Tax=Snodgrassella communis TaxID=2946699 RepID=UPI001EF4CA55|nr:P-loop NTPase fold protein [Snodgrassella communis]